MTPTQLKKVKASVNSIRLNLEILRTDQNFSNVFLSSTSIESQLQDCKEISLTIVKDNQ